MKPSTPQDKGKEIALVLRLSTPKDLKVTMFEANIVREYLLLFLFYFFTHTLF